MIHFFQIHHIAVVLLLFFAAELLFAVGLLHGYFRLRQKKAQKREQQLGVKLYEDAVSHGMQQAHMLIYRAERKPVYMTDNFSAFVGVRKERISDDLYTLSEVMGQKLYKKFSTAYENWDGKAALELEYYNQKLPEKQMRITVLPTSHKEVDFFVFTDITKQKHYEQELEEKLLQAKEASQSKTTFLSRMSHEIRTPINGMIGMLSLAQKQVAAGSELYGYLNKAQNLSKHLVALVNDILDMSRIEAGKIELENQPFDLTVLADKLKNMFAQSIEEKGIRYVVELLDFEHPVVIGDEFRLSQVLINFLSNAVKFTQEGEIRVTFREMLKEEGYVDVMIRVRDSGIGMDPQFVRHIFEPFVQENADTSKKYGGTGLGMAISDQIIRLMGGDIVIDSMPGRGSDFTVYLHMKVAEESVMEAFSKKTPAVLYADDYTYEGKSILLAEDNEINAEIATEILKEEGARVEVAHNGEEAVACFASHEPGYYDFILMDIQMPLLNGRDATRKIRQMEREDAASIMIFALSADAFLEDVRISKEAGMDGHFAKPVDFEQVRKQIGQVVAERKGAEYE